MSPAPPGGGDTCARTGTPGGSAGGAAGAGGGSCAGGSGGPARFARICVPCVAFFAPYGLSLPLCTLYIERRVCDEMGASDCSDSAVSARAARWSAAWLSVLLGAGLVVVASLGPRSDVSGRRTLTILPCVGSCLAAAASAAVSHWRLPLWVFIAAWGMNGLFGGLYLFILGAMSAIADISSPSERTGRIGICEGLLYFVITVTNLCSGLAADHLGFTVSFLAQTGIALAALGLTALLVPETLPVAPSPPDRGGGGCAAHLRAPLRLLRQRRRRWMLLLHALGCLCIPLMTSTLVLLTRHCFGWSRTRTGYVLAWSHSMKGVGAVVLLPALKRRTPPPPDILLLAVSLGAEAAAWGLVGALGSAEYGYGFWASQLLLLVAGWRFPVTRALLSASARAEQQGAVFALVALVESTMGMFSAQVMQQGLYAGTVSHGCPGCAYYVAAALAVVALAIVPCAAPRGGAGAEPSDSDDPRSDADSALVGGGGCDASGAATEVSDYSVARSAMLSRGFLPTPQIA